MLLKENITELEENKLFMSMRYRKIMTLYNRTGNRSVVIYQKKIDNNWFQAVGKVRKKGKWSKQKYHSGNTCLKLIMEDIHEFLYPHEKQIHI